MCNLPDWPLKNIALTFWPILCECEESMFTFISGPFDFLYYVIYCLYTPSTVDMKGDWRFIHFTINKGCMLRGGSF